jgi:hypothetical protein
LATVWVLQAVNAETMARARRGAVFTERMGAHRPVDCQWRRVNQAALSKARRGDAKKAIALVQ